MLRLSGWVAVSVLIAALSSRLAAEEPPEELEKIPELFPAGEKEEALEPAAPERLPQPSIREPFSIGEALYFPARVPAAVVSLLDLLGVPIVADQEAADAATRPTLSEAEVRTLIDMGVADAEAAAENDDAAPPYSFADLHALVARHLPELTLDELAEAYAQAYERRPDGVAPSVMMGQPISPETPLSRVQIWLLLVDGMVGSSRPAALPAASRTVAAQLEQWRAADRDWHWYLVHELLIASRVPLLVTPASASAHEGHGGPGARVTFTASLGTAPAAIRAPGGAPLLVPRAGASTGGTAISWQVDPGSLASLSAHGTLQGAVNAPAAGSATLGYLPQRERANGRGDVQRETATIRASVRLRDLIGTVFDSPMTAGTSRLLGSKEAPVAVGLEWHSSGMKLRLENSYNVALDFGPLGNTRRRGAEGIRGVLELQADGTYRGNVLARSYSMHVGYSPLKECGIGFSRGSQRLLVIATPGAELTRYQSTTRIQVREGQTDGGLISLRFEPLTDPVFTTRDECQDSDELLRPGSNGAVHFLPFNDARWWTPEHTFVIRTPRQGKLVYEDGSLAGPPSSTLGPTTAIIKGTDTLLTIEVERTETP